MQGKAENWSMDVNTRGQPLTQWEPKGLLGGGAKHPQTNKEVPAHQRANKTFEKRSKEISSLLRTHHVSQFDPL